MQPIDIESAERQREFYQALVEELTAKYNQPRDKVVADIIKLKPDAARWIADAPQN